MKSGREFSRLQLPFHKPCRIPLSRLPKRDNHMKRIRQIGFLFLILTMSGCSIVKESAEPAKPPTKSTSGNSQTNTTPTSRLCALFTAGEIKELLGAPVGEGYVTGPMDSACRWDNDRSDESAVYAQIQMVGTEFWEKHSGAKGYEVLNGIGKEAFVASSLGGWEAGTVTDKAVVFVSVNGGSANRDTAVKLLRDTLGRLAVK